MNAQHPSVALAGLAERLSKDPLPLHGILAGLGPQGPALLALLLALPFPIPGSLPGTGMAFGCIIAGLGLAMVTGHFRWPQSGALARPLGGPVLSKILSIGASLLRRLERMTRARWTFAADTGRAWRAAGVSLAVLGIVLALPLPPGTNSPPAIGIILLTLGLLTRDGLFTIGGHIVACANVVALAALGIFGFEAIEKLTRSLL